jgi:hypothetical protein
MTGPRRCLSLATVQSAGARMRFRTEEPKREKEKPKTKSKTKTKTFYERKIKNHRRLDLSRPPVGPAPRLPKFKTRKESWRRVASLPPPGSSLYEKMLSTSGSRSTRPLVRFVVRRLFVEHSQQGSGGGRRRNPVMEHDILGRQFFPVELFVGVVIRT